MVQHIAGRNPAFFTALNDLHETILETIVDPLREIDDDEGAEDDSDDDLDNEFYFS